MVTNYCVISDNCNKGNATDNPKIWCDLRSQDDDLYNQSCTGVCAVSYKNSSIKRHLAFSKGLSI